MKTGLREERDLDGGKVIALQAFAAIAVSMLGLWPGGGTPAVQAQPLTEPNNSEIQQETAHCIPRDLSALVTQLMLDLPSYGNRVIQRASSLGNSSSLYLMLAGQAEIRPVSLEAFADNPNRSRLPVDGSGGKAPAEEIYQIFFTTLERQYVRSGRRSPSLASATIEQTLQQAAPSFQQFHWLILARQQDEAGAPWQVISLRSQLAPFPAGDQLLAPVRSSRQGPVGQGLALWLRDWHSGTISLSAVTLDSSPVTGAQSNPHCMTP